MISERKFIEKIRAVTGRERADIVKGIGDDCAVIRRTDDRLTLLTTDTLVESVHFDCSWHRPRLLGRKSANVNISDIAAMGGKPMFALLSLAFPEGISEEWQDEFMSGFIEALTEHEAALIGGDTVKSSGPIMISVTLAGEAGENKILYRSGARLGNEIFVSRPLGGAAAGLALCRSGVRLEDSGQWRTVVSAHLDPRPETELAFLLAESGYVTAMLDSSDGPATDIAHLCAESGVAAEIDAAALPISPNTIAAAESLQMNPTELALSGGEDYALIFCAAPENKEKIFDLIQKKLDREIFAIGRIVMGQGVFLLKDGEKKEIGYRGYDHFLSTCK